MQAGRQLNSLTLFRKISGLDWDKKDMINSKLTPVAVGTGSIEQYIQTVNSIPMLTLEEEKDLGERLKYHNDLEAAKKLVLSHLRLVVSIARGYDGYGLNQADLIQEGNIGLMKAVKRFDISKGVRLVSFAIHWIKAEIHEFILRNWRMVRIATTKPQRKLFFNLRSMRKDTGTLSMEEAERIAGDLGVKVSEVLEMEQRMTGKDLTINVDESDDERPASPIDWLSDEQTEQENMIEQEESHKMQTVHLKEALEQLDERSRDIIMSRWLQDDGKGATLHDLAAKYGVSAERIRQLETKAMAKMKGFLTETCM